jgi:excisionase family DNA binding protein
MIMRRRKGLGSVRPTASGHWQARSTDRAGIRLTRTFEDRDDALEWLARPPEPPETPDQATVPDGASLLVVSREVGLLAAEVLTKYAREAVLDEPTGDPDQAVTTAALIDLAGHFRTGNPLAATEILRPFAGQTRGKVTTIDAAARAGRSARTLRRWAQEGRVPAQKVGRRWLLDPTDVEDSR